jgi:hypothetical protein
MGIIYNKKSLEELAEFFDLENISYGAGRIESGVCLFISFKKGYAVGGRKDYDILMSLADIFVNYTAKQWYYDEEASSETSIVCGDNPNSSGVTLVNSDNIRGSKLQIFLNKTFGVNGLAISWKGGMELDEMLLPKFARWFTEKLGAKLREGQDGKLHPHIKPGDGGGDGNGDKGKAGIDIQVSSRAFKS